MKPGPMRATSLEPGQGWMVLAAGVVVDSGEHVNGFERRLFRDRLDLLNYFLERS
jgi:hypothetical protein